jgi:hypothetical protein
MLISQVEIYDQLWYVRHLKEFIVNLEEIPDGCAEIFPFELIDELKEEFLCG